MHNETQQTIFRHDYSAPDYLVDTVEMGFDLDPNETRVANRMTLTRSPSSKTQDILLHGNGLKLAQLRMNGIKLGKKDYAIESGDLRIFNAPEQATLEIETIIQPAKNTSLMGLYVSSGNFFTQCEAEGFRKITFFPDRPDVMTKFTVMLRASKKNYPVLLSNGNLIEQGDLGDGRHYAKWEDPFRKPAYLFATRRGQTRLSGRNDSTEIRSQGFTASVGGERQSRQDPARHGIAETQRALG